MRVNAGVCMVGGYMHSERVFPRVNRAFQDGSLADKVVLSLAKVGAGQPMDAASQAAIQEAVAFLSRAREGFGWLDTARISAESKTAARSFELAVRTRPTRSSPTAFIEDLDRMLDALKALLAEGRTEKPDVDSLEKARRFFGRLLRASVSEIDNLLSPLEPARNPGWTLDSRSKR